MSIQPSVPTLTLDSRICGAALFFAIDAGLKMLFP
jgi:hypothetical protein